MKSIVYMNVVPAKNRTLYNYILNLKEDQNVPESRSRVLRVGVWMLSQEKPLQHTHWLLCSLQQIFKCSKCAIHVLQTKSVQNQFLPFSLGMSVSVEGDRL